MRFVDPQTGLNVLVEPQLIWGHEATELLMEEVGVDWDGCVARQAAKAFIVLSTTPLRGISTLENC